MCTKATCWQSEPPAREPCHRRLREHHCQAAETFFCLSFCRPRLLHPKPFYEHGIPQRYLRFCQFVVCVAGARPGTHATGRVELLSVLGADLFAGGEVGEDGKQERRVALTSSGKEVPVDGSGTPYAATRAWGWKHGFLEVALTALAARRRGGAEQLINVWNLSIRG